MPVSSRLIEAKMWNDLKEFCGGILVFGLGLLFAITATVVGIVYLKILFRIVAGCVK